MKLAYLVAACLVAAACGGTTSGDEPFCGDNHMDPGEQCDLGGSNGAPGVACSATCMAIDKVCGDGILELDEECDDGSGANGAVGDRCDADCKVDPLLTVDWQISPGLASAGPPAICPWWPSGSGAPPAPSTSSIELLAVPVGPSTIQTCTGCTVATFDCSDGKGAIRLPKGMYDLGLEPVQVTDDFFPSTQLSYDLQADANVSFSAQQGGMLHVVWSQAAAPGCASISVEVLDNTFDGKPLDLQQIPITIGASADCTATSLDLGPFPTVDGRTSAASGEYTVTVSVFDAAGTLVEAGTNQATIPRSNEPTQHVVIQLNPAISPP